MIPIILHAHELAALQAGRLSQIRRPVEPQPGALSRGFEWHVDGGTLLAVEMASLGNLDTPPHEVPWGDCPLGAPGARLRVLEEWWHYVSDEIEMAGFLGGTVTRKSESDGYPFHPNSGFDPAAYEIWNPESPESLPEWASRYYLDVVSVRVEQAQYITPSGCVLAGIDGTPAAIAMNGHVDIQYAVLWDAHHPDHPWASNPWQWVVDVKEVRK